MSPRFTQVADENIEYLLSKSFFFAFKNFFLMKFVFLSKFLLPLKNIFVFAKTN